MPRSLRTQLDELATDPTALDAAINRLLEEGDPQLADVAAWAADRGDVERLLRLMDDFVANARLDTVEAIRRTLPTTGAALTARIETMMEHHGGEVRRAGALFSGLLGLQTLAPRLVQALEDPYFLMRMEAAFALGKLRYPPAVEPLRSALADEDILVRGAAIEALTLIPDPDLLTAYVGRFSEDPPAYYRGAFDDRVARARAHAIRMLQRHRPPCARAALTAYVSAWEETEAEAEAPITEDDREVTRLARAVLTELER